MKKATVEDSGSNVRTVKLARGSIPSNSPQRATSTPSGRYPGERRSSSKLMSPDEKELTVRSLRSLSQVGILEVLEQDDRLIFILDLGNYLNFQPGPVHTVYANATLKAYGLVFDMIRGRATEDLTTLTGTNGFAEFKSWATSFVQDGEALDVSLPAFSFCGASWTSSTLRKKFRIFYGILPSGSLDIPSNPPTLAASTISSRSHHSNHSPVATNTNEALASEASDYFGNVQQGLASTSIGETSGEIIASVETPSTAIKQSFGFSDPVNLEDSMVLSDSANGGNIAQNGFHVTETLPRLTAETMLPTLVPSNTQDQGFFDWTRLPLTAALPKHIQFARSIDWASTSLGPIETWPAILRSTCNLLMASPHPAAMYWGEDNVALYNEPYILLAGHKHPKLMGQTYRDAWGEIWEDVKDSFLAAKLTGQSTMKDDDRLFVNRSGFLEETYFSW